MSIIESNAYRLANSCGDEKTRLVFDGFDGYTLPRIAIQRDSWGGFCNLFHSICCFWRWAPTVVEYKDHSESVLVNLSSASKRLHLSSEKIREICQKIGGLEEEVGSRSSELKKIENILPSLKCQTVDRAARFLKRLDKLSSIQESRHVMSRELQNSIIYTKGRFFYFEKDLVPEIDEIIMLCREVNIETLNQLYVFLADLGGGKGKRINRELDFLRLLQGEENFVKLVCSGTCENHSFMFQEFYELGDLQDLLERKNPILSISDKINIANDFLKGLAYLHSLRICQNDVKLENIFITKDSRIRAVIGDFDLAYHMDDEDSLTFRFSGTLEYDAPEKMRGSCFIKGDQADIWSAGKVLFFLFESELKNNLLKQIDLLDRDFNGFEEKDLENLKECPLDYLIASMLVYNPHHRPTANGVLSKLNEIFTINECLSCD